MSLKEYIRGLSREQIVSKIQRKTGTIVVKRNEWGGVIFSDRMRSAREASERIILNKVKITAALNLYHFMKDDEYTGDYHKVSYEYMCAGYKGFYEALEAKYKK